MNGLEEDINPHQNVVLNKVYREDAKTAQIEHWSVLSDVVKIYNITKTQTPFKIWTLKP